MKTFWCPIFIVIAVCFVLTEASFPPNRNNYPDGYFFGTQNLACVLTNWKRSNEPTRGTWDVSHRLIYYRNTVYEFALKGVDMHDSPDWQAARKCPVQWEWSPAANSKCSPQSLKAFAYGYSSRYGGYNLFTNNNCHKFANRVSAFLFNSNCGRYSWPN